jgi:UDP-glucose 4-epimerase
VRPTYHLLEFSDLGDKRVNEPFDVVTGGAGFIGSHISRGLLKRGRRVRVIDNLSTGRLSNIEDLQDEFPDSFELVQEDIRDLEILRKLLKGSQTVYHQAAVPSVQRSVENPIESNEANINGTLNVFLAARDAGVGRTVYASSSSVYGDSEMLPKQESMQANPISPYAVAKYTNELYGKVFSNIYDLPCIGLRYFNVFGPFQDPSSDYAAVIPKFITRMLRGQPPIIFGDGEQSRDFTFVENVVAANLGAASSQVRGLSLNIACGERFTLNQLVEKLNEILGTDLVARYEEPRPGDVKHSLAAIENAKEAIGFSPEIGFLEGLKRTVEWYREGS